MPLDGVTLSSVVRELSESLVGGRVDKVQQPEADELILSVRSKGQNYKLLLTANANSPRLHLTETTKVNPNLAPMFCMLLRKHLGGGRIKNIVQPDFERIVELHIESPNEMGDLQVKCLVVEIMGKHSNIILVDSEKKILDSIRHVSRERSSVREVLPGKIYDKPPLSGKVPPVPVDSGYFLSLFSPGKQLQNLIYQSFNGISPILASEICIRAGVAPETFAETLTEQDKHKIIETFLKLYNDIDNGNFSYNIYDISAKKRDFSAVNLSVYLQLGELYKTYESPSKMLEDFYITQDSRFRIAQKTADLKKLVQNHLERCVRKSENYNADLCETQNKEQQRHFGELLTAYIHTVPKGADRVKIADFYNNNAEVEIPLNPTLTPAENAQKFFKSYNKSKRTFAALQGQITSNNADIAYLDSVLSAIASATTEEDIAEIRTELAEQGFIKRVKNLKGSNLKGSNGAKNPNSSNGRKNKKSVIKKSKPLKYCSSDGFYIYVGKNNLQNDELTLKFANSTDIWLHTKEIAGSHVIIKGEDVPERTIKEAANLAAYHSKARMSSQVPVDFCPRKNVRKPKGAKPGFVIYDFYNTVYVTPQEQLQPVEG
ncbi:MAG: NFACT family protein [Firmicutes bacterium]|nr:NFACT family protein [Bacillota bacterium]